MDPEGVPFLGRVGIRLRTLSEGAGRALVKLYRLPVIVFSAISK